MRNGTPQRVDYPPCSVCGSIDVMHDEVVEPEAIQIAECQRCEHRWTSPAPAVDTIPAAVGLVRSTTRKEKIPSAA